jgi:hypothetical protein
MKEVPVPKILLCWNNRPDWTRAKKMKKKVILLSRFSDGVNEFLFILNIIVLEYNSWKELNEKEDVKKSN